ncbi:hypothetical protein BGZ82_009109 [Podila clonocystis]|nr:hypothetical protein BGZ82_009109 [Podila clonocystis]
MSTIINQNNNLTAVDDLQLTALGINLGTNVALSLFTLAAFCWLRPKNGVIYAKKYKYSAEDKRAPRLEEGYFSWMGPVWSCPDQVLVDKIGLDAVVFIRFIRMCRQVFMAMAVIGCGALIPINVIATIRAQPNGETPQDKIGMLSIKGIKDLNWIWAHVGAMWAFSAILMFAMYHGYTTFMKYRIKYFESDAYQENMASRTVMLAGLPASLQSDEKLAEFMRSLGMQDQPVQALVGRKVDKLPDLMDKHKQMVTSLEKVMSKYFADPNKLPAKRPTVSVGKFCGSKVDAIDYYSQQIEELTDQIEKTRKEISKSQPTNYGFVSYATINAAHRVARELSNPVTLRQRSKMIDPPELFLSPVPKDIIWFNVSNPKQLRKSRRIIVNTLFVIASLLFFIPMGFLTTLAKLDRIIGLIPSTKPWFQSHPAAMGIIQSLLPILFMDILFMLIRKAIAYLAWFQGNITKSSTDRSTLAKFYLFFTVNNLIIFALSGTIIGFFAQVKLFLSNLELVTWAGIKEFVAKQDNIVELLSQNVIDSSLFWVNYMSLRNFGALLDLFQLVSLFLYWAKSTVTARENKQMDKPAVFDFPTFFSAHMFLLTVALLYSVVAPLVLFFAVVYFSLASLVYKYQLMYVFRTKVETGGRLFRVVYNRLLVALVLFQVVMIGILNLKEAHKHSIAVLPLPILTILFKIFLAKTFDPKIDFYDYGSARNESHLFKNSNNKGSGKGNSLLSTFENPVFQSKMISALVPDGAKKMLSSKVLNGGRDNLTEDKKKPKASTLAYGKQSMSPPQSPSNQFQPPNYETYEMSHVGKSSKSNPDYQVLGYDDSNNYSSKAHSPRTQNQNHNQQYDKTEYLGDDSLDDYYDNQKQSLTKSASQPSSVGKVYGAQDMTSFVAGRYTERPSPADPYNYNKGNTSESGATKPSYMELAKMHQTDNYKNTGRAMQYEETNVIHLPSINFPKMQSSSPRPGRRNVEQPPPIKIADPFFDPGQSVDRQLEENKLSPKREGSTGYYYAEYEPSVEQWARSSPRMPKESPRMPKQSPRMPTQSPAQGSPRRVLAETKVHSSSSSPSLVSSTPRGDYVQDSPRTRQQTRANTYTNHGRDGTNNDNYSNNNNNNYY